MDSSLAATDRTPDPAGSEAERTSHRGYGLVIQPSPDGWEARIEDPAGHAADVVLQQQLAVAPFATAEHAQQAAVHFVDDLLAQESSY